MEAMEGHMEARGRCSFMMRIWGMEEIRGSRGVMRVAERGDRVEGGAGTRLPGAGDDVFR